MELYSLHIAVSLTKGMDPKPADLPEVALVEVYADLPTIKAMAADLGKSLGDGLWRIADNQLSADKSKL